MYIPGMVMAQIFTLNQGEIAEQPKKAWQEDTVVTITLAVCTIVLSLGTLTVPLPFAGASPEPFLFSPFFSSASFI